MTSEPAAESRERFIRFFQQATNGNDPLPYQRRLALSDSIPSLLDIPTGLGKTAAAILAWVWRRRFAGEEIRDQTPRRLVYCLPMRVLVEQTHGETVKWLYRLGMLAGKPRWTETGSDGLPTRQSQLSGGANGQERGYEVDPDAIPENGWGSQHGDLGTCAIAVHLLLGGEEKTEWDLFPERDAILIGTQDMLLSRALNRGYGMCRYRWPVHFGLLSNDCHWVIDEVQLMGSGLLTTAQLAAFGDTLWRRVKPCQFLWMSATLGESFLSTRDRQDWSIPPMEKLGLSPEDLDPEKSPVVLTRLRAKKVIDIVKDRPKPSLILDEHAEHGQGRLSLLVFNTVPAARRMFAELQAEANKTSRRRKCAVPELCLVHGRFRPGDRKRQLQQVASFTTQMDSKTGAVPENPGLLLVSTQVVEAGFDISSVRLWSEVAPWPSIVQRLGRLNREGRQPSALATFWRPKDEKDGENKPESPNAKRIGPYDKSAIDNGQQLLTEVQQAIAEGAEYRDALDAVSRTDASLKTLQVTADSVIRPDDFLQLFGTEPDLAGGFTNISQFVRDSDRNGDAQVFWRDFSPKQGTQLDEPPPHREELCAVPFFELRRFLGKKGGAWEWNGEAGQWERRSERDVWPGMTLLLPLSAGGYSDSLGWTGDGGDKPTVDVFPTSENLGLQDDPDSQAEYWHALGGHLLDVELEVGELIEGLQLVEAAALQTAARWHDWGKALPKWQCAALSFAASVRTRIHDLMVDPKAAQFHELLARWLPRWTPPPSSDGTTQLWAKFPDVRDIWRKSALTSDDAKYLRRLLHEQFTPRLRHEAASALAAWDAWVSNDAGLTALAVYLIASHHGKVRTVLRSSRDNDDVFGLTVGDALPPVPGHFPIPAALHFEVKHLGAHGTWGESGSVFEVLSPSWTEMVADLLGSAVPNAKPIASAIPQEEQQNLGPLALAFYEAILVAADVRASKRPGKAKKVQP